MITAWRKLRGRSLAELQDRARQAILAHVERVQLAIGIRSQGTQGEQTLKISNLFGHDTSPADIVTQIVRGDPEAMNAHRQVFASLLRGQAALLGLPPLSINDPPQWHRDAHSGREAPLVHWSRVPYLDAAIVGDHKILWELNRHQYLLSPAMCWLLDADARAFALIERHLGSWLDANPYRLGANWASSLEVSYRAITWCWLLWWLQDAPWDSVLLRRLHVSLELHALHIERYLSTYFSPNTHLTGEALGLFYVGTVLRTSQHSARWRKVGSVILESCLNKQVYKDGVYFEQATQYQRYTTEIYLHYWHLAQASDWPVSLHVRAGVNRLFDVLRSIVVGSGCMPLFGDDDGGLLMPVDGRPPDDLRGLLLVGATALARPDLLVSGVVHPSLSYWICGAAATEQQLSRGAVVPDWADMLFAQGGTAVLRDGWDSNAAVAIVDAGQHGALNCGHAHADALSCTLSLGGSDVFVDRGTLTYVGIERNEFRATCSHNTLEFDAESSVSPLGPFQWGKTPNRPAARLRTSGNLRVFEAIAHGHAGTTNPSTHQRVILHLPHGAWIVYDRGNRQGARGAVARWQLAPGLTVNECADGAYDLLDSQQQTVGRVVAPLSASIVVRQRDVSPRYGSRLPAQVFELGTDSQLRALTLLLPTMLNWPLPNIARISATDRSGWEWHDAHGNHRIMVSPESSRRIVGLLGWNIDADLLWCCRTSPVRASDGFTADLMVVVNATLLVAPDGTEFASVVDASPGQARGAVVLSRTPQGWAKMATSEPVRGLEPK